MTSSDYKILDIRKVLPLPKSYFFDANVWILILKSPSKLNSDETPYINFFDALCNLKSTIESKGKLKVIPEIIITPLLLSEIFNTYTRIAFRSWKDELFHTGKKKIEEINKLDYKRDYRKEDHYDNAVSQFKSDFLAHKEIFRITDDVGKVDPLSLLENFPANTDFNDQYYYLFCFENKYSFVTNDSDFVQAHVEIITCNKELLKHKN